MCKAFPRTFHISPLTPSSLGYERCQSLGRRCVGLSVATRIRARVFAWYSAMRYPYATEASVNSQLKHPPKYVGSLLETYLITNFHGGQKVYFSCDKFKVFLPFVSVHWFQVSKPKFFLLLTPPRTAANKVVRSVPGSRTSVQPVPA